MIAIYIIGLVICQLAIGFYFAKVDDQEKYEFYTMMAFVWPAVLIFIALIASIAYPVIGIQKLGEILSRKMKKDAS